MRVTVLVALGLLALPGCEHRGNLRAAADYGNVSARPIANPFYDPYAAVGSANVRWRPSVFDRDGTVFRPGSHNLSGSSYGRPAGTF